MRGAMIIDIDTGIRLEENKEKGIRTIKVDWEDRDLANKSCYLLAIK
jgi:6-carboxyhexanoate-CoA ligase